LFDVRIYNQALDQAAVLDLIPQNAPQGLAATAGSQKVSLTWTPSLGATEYKVWTKNTVTNAESTNVVTQPPFLKTGLTNGQPYLFKVLATNGAGDGPYSTEISATPAAGTAKDILSFMIGGQPAKISGTTIIRYMPVGTDVTVLSAEYTVSAFASEDSINPAGSFLDFTTPKNFTITAENGSTKVYTASVVLADPITYNFDSDIQGWTQIWPLAGDGNLGVAGGLGSPEGADGYET